jgi:hypothetical protein
MYCPIFESKFESISSMCNEFQTPPGTKLAENPDLQIKFYDVACVA